MGLMKNERIDIAVLGAGASGFAAAIAAARRGCRTVLFEATGRVAQSIKVTGDGRCNIANASTDASAYRNPSFAARAFNACSPEDAIAFLESCGLLLREETAGRLYPQANKSTSVIDALRLSAQRAGVREVCGKRAVRIEQCASGWRVAFADTSAVECASVVVAVGGSLDAHLLPQGLPVLPMTPVLGPLATDSAPLRGLDKVRAKCALTAHGVREDGEITFRSYGISGIAAFNASRLVEPGDSLSIDFLPHMAAQDSLPYLRQRADALQPRTWMELTCGILLPLVAHAVLRAAKLRDDDAVRAESLPRLDAALRAFSLTVRGIGDARLCQVHRGGVDCACMDASTMQATGQPGLHVTGEAVDMDAPCGGYNLHWAWVSGIIAGAHAAETVQGGRP